MSSADPWLLLQIPHCESLQADVVQTHRTALLVLDEADQLLAPHFRSELLRLLEHVGAPADDGARKRCRACILSVRLLHA